MRYLRVLTLLTVVSWTTSEAWGQYGLYGSPEMLRLPPTDSQATGHSGYPSYSASGYPGEASGYAGQTVQVAADTRPPLQPAPLPAEHAPRLGQPDQHAPNVVSQMLDESDCYPPSPSWLPDAGSEGGGEYGYDPGCGYGAFEGAIGGAGPCGAALPCLESMWYGSVSGLIMSRDEPNRLWVSYENGVNENQLMDTQDTQLQWRAGGEVCFGRRFCCGNWAVEARFWTLEAFSGLASQTHPSFVSTPLDFTDVVYANAAIPGLPVDLFDRAQEHRLWRDNELYNVELNLIRSQADCNRCSAFDLGWSVGVRFFRFEESLLFGSLDEGGTGFGVDPTMEGYLDDNIINNLVGVQFGCDLNYHLAHNWRMFIAPKVGIYNNHIEHRFSAYRGDGELFDTVPADYPGYPIESSKDVVSFMTQIDLGLVWQVSPSWSAHIGYRVAIATGMGLADHQIPPYVVDTPELADIDYNGYLLLHGGFAGLTFNF